MDSNHQASNIILLDSSETCRDIAEAVLNMCGFSAIKASTWSDALNAISNAQAVFLDLNLPQISGDVVADMLRRNFPSVRLYIYRTELDDDSLEVARKLGAAGVLNGRCRPDVLLSEVRALDLWL